MQKPLDKDPFFGYNIFILYRLGETMTEHLSALAIRFEKANAGMLTKNNIIKQNKLENTRERATY